MIQKTIFKQERNTQNYMFSYYDKELTRINENFNTANIVAELDKSDGSDQIIIYENSPTKKKMKICNVFSDEIHKILSEKNIYIKPKKINTLMALKKAIVMNILG